AGNFQHCAHPGRRDRADGHPCPRRRRAERQQGVQRRALALRHCGLVLARFLQGAVAGAARQSHHQRRRVDHQGPAIPHPGTEPGRCPGTPDRTDPQRHQGRKEAPSDQTDPGLEETSPGIQDQARFDQGRARQGGLL
ncbi:Peptidyl-tRNA hydrolase ArfB (EC 3.1.1.29), partial [Pseudomonas sp. FG-3G]